MHLQKKLLKCLMNNIKKRPKENFIILFLLVFLFVINISCKHKNSFRSLHIIYMGKDVTNELLNFNPSLLNDDETRNVVIDNGKDKNVLTISKDAVQCIESNCQDKICVQRGKITNEYDNEMIVCMPHGLLIYYD